MKSNIGKLLVKATLVFALLLLSVPGSMVVADETVMCEDFGRTVTILLTLSEPGEGGGPGPVDYMATLLDNSVSWAGKNIPDMKVLVIRDDNHSGEWTWDTDNIYNTLLGLGYDTTLVDESGSGVPYAALEGYDVVLLSNPGYQLDDLLTAASLHQVYHNGGGVILQGDDIS